MSESAVSDSVRSELPRLRIHHLLVLTAIFSLVMSTSMGMWRLARSNNPNTVIPEIGGVTSLALIGHNLSHAICISVVAFGIVWRKRGIRFPSQPGHWIAIYMSMAWAYGTILRFASSMWLAVLGDFLIAVWLFASLAFHSLSAALWVFAFWREPARIWRWGWAAMALRSALSLCLSIYYLVAKCIEWLLEVFWYNHHLDWQPYPVRWLGSYAFVLINWVPNLAVLLFLVAAVAIDYRQDRPRDWSHWSVVVLTFVATLVSTGYLISYYIRA